MASVITIAGEQLFAAKAQANEQLDIDTFIFANVPNQDPNAPINREEGIPTANIVYQQNVQQVGRINDNVVVYSTVLDSITGPFEFNWVGLYSSVNQKLVAINHVPTVTKTATAPGAAGNTLNRNFGIEYSGIADLTGITVDAGTWQLDFTARLSGMDLLTQQLAADMNGKDWFIDDGLKVVPRATANTFSVTPGVGYVSGLRVELKQEHILIVQSYPQFVYVDAWFSGNANSTWSPQLAFTVTNTEMDDYIDPSGTQHYVYKLAVVNAADDVIDIRQNSRLLPLDATKYLPEGYVKDGTVNYTAYIQKAIMDAASRCEVILPNFKLLIDPVGTDFGGLNIPSNSKVIFNENTELIVKDNNLGSYEILSCRDVENIELVKPSIKGDKLTHTGIYGEWGMGIAVRGNCKDIKIISPKVKECWGDGVYIGQIYNGDGTAPENIHIENPKLTNNRRQGMSVTSVDGLYIKNPEINGTKSSDSPFTLINGPHAGIDFEPNHVNSKLNRIVIDSINGNHNDGGLVYVFLGGVETEPGQRYHVDININNIVDNGSSNAVHLVGLNKNSRYSGGVNIGFVNSNNPVNGGVISRNWYVQCGLPVNIGPTNISNWKSLITNPARLRAAVSIYQSGDDNAPEIGNLFIEKLNLRNTLSAESLSNSVIFAENSSNAGIKNVDIILGIINTNLDGSILAECPGGVINFEGRGDFGKKLRILRTGSANVSETLIADIDVIPTGASPTLTLPNEIKTIYAGSKRRMRYTQSGTASFVRLRSNTLPMYVNGIVNTNALFNEMSGTVDIEFGKGIFYITCKGPYTKES
ncbi:phage tail protein [Shewanella oncorhynchi]|uniref:phage tail-collar fiber domain-containing protein n=1 Tax=Shewanella oncorhynchi TaxID=2726434 RepID=UPI003D7A34C4